jgi:hypothetical protein
MGSSGISRHAHVDAGFFALLFTLLIYGIKWIFDLSLPASIFILPTFVAVFIGSYAIMFLVFLIAWNKK